MEQILMQFLLLSNKQNRCVLNPGSLYQILGLVLQSYLDLIQIFRISNNVTYILVTRDTSHGRGGPFIQTNVTHKTYTWPGGGFLIFNHLNRLV